MTKFRREKSSTAPTPVVPPRSQHGAAGTSHHAQPDPKGHRDDLRLRGGKKGEITIDPATKLRKILFWTLKCNLPLVGI